MRRVWLVAIVVGSGCDRAFGLDYATDARPIDARPLDAAIDAALVTIVGCADGTREGFADLALFPKVAACQGAWNVAGLDANREAACDPASPTSLCAAVNVCAPGWRVCRGASEAAGRFTSCQITANGFFATAQHSLGNASCDATGSNDLFGCHGPPEGALAPASNCLPLDATSGEGCVLIGAPWVCPSGIGERDLVTKGAGEGGVLCCTD